MSALCYFNRQCKYSERQLPPRAQISHTHNNVEMAVHLEIIAHRSTGLHGISFPSVRFLIMSTLNLEFLGKKGRREAEKRKEGK